MNPKLTTKIGWFKESSLHGYGKLGSEEGLFERDSLHDKNSITYYDGETDIVAKKLELEEYYVTTEELQKIKISLRKKAASIVLIKKD